jgi:hypothetical protein
MQRCLRAAALLCALFCAHAAPCTRTFANMTTCAVLNGVPANGTQLEVSGTNKIQSVVATMWTAGASILTNGAYVGRSSSDACRATFYAYNCAMLLESRSGIAGDGPYMYAGVCDTTGAHMRPCLAWCHQYHQVCYGLQPQFLINNECAGNAPLGSPQCFGAAGVNGMFPAEPPAPPSGTFSNGFSRAAPRRSGAWAALALAALAVSLQKQSN